MACMLILVSIAVIVLNVGNVLVALLLDAIGHIGAQFDANDYPLRQGHVPPSWS